MCKTQAASPHICQPPRELAGKGDGVEQYKDEQRKTMQGVEKCKLFQAGRCNCGDQCKFAHTTEQLAIAHPSVIEEGDEEDDLIVWQAYVPSDEEDSYYEKATIESDEEHGEVISW